jgi:hypothetical protein
MTTTVSGREISSESEFVNVKKPRNRFQGNDAEAGPSNRVFVPARQAGNGFMASLKGLQIQALNP